MPFPCLAFCPYLDMNEPIEFGDWSERAVNAAIRAGLTLTDERLASPVRPTHTGNRQAMFFFDPTSLLQVDIDTDWAMVGAPFVGPEKSLVYAPHRSRRCEDVVDPPSDVPLARAAPLPPPRVLARLLGMQGAKDIYPARVDPAVEFGPLLGEEPAVRDIRLRAR